MRFALIALVLASLAFAQAAGASKVLDLNEGNFDSTIAANKQVLVEFFAPWCGHCKSLAPEYDSASLVLDGKDAGVLAKVDCTVEKDLCGRFDVKGFPTLKLFSGSSTNPAEYDQARKSDAIVKFMVKQVQPAVTEVADGAAAKAFASSDSVKIVAFASSEADVAVYAKLAQSLRNEYSFALVKGSAAEAAASEFKATVPSVVVRRDFDEGDVVYSGAFTQSDISSFIKTQSFPLVGTIGPENYSKYVERGLNFVWVFVDNSDSAQTALIADAITPVAAKNRATLSFVRLDGVKWAEHGKSLGLASTTPGIVIEDRETRKRFVFSDASITAATFGDFVSGFNAGTLQPSLKSDPIPETNDEPVKVVVGKTFDQIVLDDSKDVLVEFYAPWCGHCKSLAPKYDELGALFASNPNVVIAKLDATTNDHPANVQGFPTIILYAAGKKSSPQEYNGGRTVEDMAKFLRENGSKAGSGSAAASATKGSEHEEL